MSPASLGLVNSLMVLTRGLEPATDGLKVRYSTTELWEYGRNNRIRTCDITLPKRALYQTELYSDGVGEGNWTLIFWLEVKSNSHYTTPTTMVPTRGLEPPTYWLQNSCSASWAKSALVSMEGTEPRPESATNSRASTTLHADKMVGLVVSLRMTVDPPALLITQTS